MPGPWSCTTTDPARHTTDTLWPGGLHTLPVAEDRTFDKLEILSVAKIIADAIDAVFEETFGVRALRRGQPRLGLPVRKV